MIKTFLLLCVLFLFNGCFRSTPPSKETNATKAIATPQSRRSINTFNTYTIANEHLYSIKEDILQIFNLSNPAELKKETSLSLNKYLQNITSYKNRLYITTDIGLYIYDISTPIDPIEVNQMPQIKSCNPMVFHDDKMYVTYNSNNCLEKINNLNRLDIIDIKDTLNPKKIQEIDMVSPLNLSVKEGRLFVCQGQVGVQIFDLTQTPVVPIYTNTTTDCFYNQVSDDNRVFMSTNYGIVQLDKNETSYSHLNTIY